MENTQPIILSMNKDSIIESNPEVMNGTHMFRGTHVLFQPLMDYLENDESLNTFLSGSPTVSREQAISVLEQAKRASTNEVAVR